MPHEYLPTDELLRVFVLFSGGASSGIGLVTGPDHGKIYEVVGAGTDKPEAGGIKKFARLGIHLNISDYELFCKSLEIDPGIGDSNKRYHNEWLSILEKYRPHVIALSGYFKIVPREFLQEYPDTKNVHPMTLHYLTTRKPKGAVSQLYDELMDVGDLDPDNVRRLIQEHKDHGIELERAFRGESAVFDAIVFGDDRTKRVRVVNELRSTVHRVVKKYDEGPIEIESAPISIDVPWVEKMVRNRNFGALMDYSKGLQNELKGKGDVPAFRKAIELTADRRLEHKDGAVYIDGQRMPYKGLQIT